LSEDIIYNTEVIMSLPFLRAFQARSHSGVMFFPFPISALYRGNSSYLVSH